MNKDTRFWAGLPAKLSLVVAAGMLSPALLQASETSDEWSETSSEQQSATSETSSSQQGSQGSDVLNQIAEEQSDLSEFVKAVEKAGMAEALTGDTQYTIFAPTNDAFESDSNLQELLESNDPQDHEELVELLRAHIVADDVDTEMAKTIGKAQTIGGGEIELTAEEDKVKVGDAEVVTADIQQGNLRIHAIDGVLEPSASASMASMETSSESSTSAAAGMDFDELDQDGDGYLSEEELQQAEQLQAQHDQLDQNQDGRVSRTEFAAFEREQRSSSGMGTPSPDEPSSETPSWEQDDQ